MTPEDHHALADLAARYALAVDERRLADAAELFTEDGTLLMPDPPAHLGPTTGHSGRAAIGHALGAVTAVPRTFHAIVGAVREPGAHPDAAVGTVSCAAHHLSQRPDGAVGDLVWYLRYTDTYQRTTDGWRIAHRAIDIDFVQNARVLTHREPFEQE